MSFDISKMSWSILSKRTYLFPSLHKNLRQAPPKSRGFCVAIGLPHSSLRTSSTRCGQGYRYGIQSLMSRSEFSTGVINKYGQLSLFRPQCSESSCCLLGFRRQYAIHSSQEQRSKKTLLYLMGLVFAMVGCSYAAVPLYRRFCQATGYGGTVQRRESVEEKIARHAQDGTVTTR